MFCNQLTRNFKKGSPRRLGDAKFPCQLKQAVPFRKTYGKVISYCLRDCLLTKRLFDLIVERGEIKHPKYLGEVIKLRNPFNEVGAEIQEQEDKVEIPF